MATRSSLAASVLSSLYHSVKEVAVSVYRLEATLMSELYDFFSHIGTIHLIHGLLGCVICILLGFSFPEPIHLY